jgi:hypothetical protein
MRQLCCVALMGAALFVCGCTSYYRVTDPTTGRQYYTTELKQRSSGSLTLKDARTGNIVSLQNSEVEQIRKEQFESGKNAPSAGGRSATVGEREVPAEGK